MMLSSFVVISWSFLIAITTTKAQNLNTITSSSRTRSYWVHPPDEYDPTQSQTYPVVIAFHGSSEIGYDVDGFALEKFFIYPNGVDGAWAGPSYANVSVAEDLQFVQDVISDISSKYQIDHTKIYATGFSNGGGFVGTIACSNVVSGLFAAFASVAGSFYTDINGPNNGCAPARSPLPILEIHGGDDETVFYDGGQGEGGVLPAIPTWLGYWADRNECVGGNTTAESDGGEVQHVSWTCGGVEGVLQHWKVDQGAHDWPSETINFDMIAAGVGPQPIEANDVVISFFDQFSLS